MSDELIESGYDPSWVEPPRNYKLLQSGVQELYTNKFIPECNENVDWQMYQEWLLQGNVPEPRDAIVGTIMKDVDLTILKEIFSSITSSAQKTRINIALKNHPMFPIFLEDYSYVEAIQEIVDSFNDGEITSDDKDMILNIIPYSESGV